VQRVVPQPREPRSKLPVSTSSRSGDERSVTSVEGPRVEPFGDAAVLIVLGERIDPTLSRRVHRLAAAIGDLAAADHRFGSPVPAYGSVLVPVDPIDPGVESASNVLRDLVAGLGDRPQTGADREASRLIEIATRYGGEDGPDLEELAARHDLRPADVIDLHASVDYLVYMLGFAPGFAYLGRVPEQIATPRRDTPRTAVPAGSVGIAGDQTGIYPFDSPGGWQLIGRTHTRLWDIARDPPALLSPGDRVRFVPVQ
jgi:KipI family sensor histidine kinase inhibitor